MPWKLLIDFDRTHRFDADGSDISSRLVSAEWSVGYQDSEATAASPNTAVFVILDDTRQFHTGGIGGRQPYDGALVGARIRLDWVEPGRNDILMWAGWINGVEPDLNYYSGFTIITARDHTSELRSAEILPKFEADVALHDAISSVFALGGPNFPYTGAAGGWTLGRNRLDDNAIYFAPSGFEVEESNYTLTWVGDAADRIDGSGVRAGSYIQDLLLPEIAGRFYSDRWGVFQFLSHEHDRNEPSALTIHGGNPLSDYAYGQMPVYNVVSVNFYPRRIGEPETVVWKSDQTGEGKSRADGHFSIHEGQTAEFRVRYTSNEPEVIVAAMDVIPPEPRTDILTIADSDVDDLTITLEAGASGADLSIFNPGPGTARPYRLQIRGTPILSKSYEQIRKTSLDSQEKHGYSEMAPVHLRFVAEENRALLYANYWLNRYRQQVNHFKALVFTFGLESSDHDYLRRSVGDKITIDMGYLGDPVEMMIVGERHTLADQIHTMEWILQVPFSPSGIPNVPGVDLPNVWNLGTGVLDVSTIYRSDTTIDTIDNALTWRGDTLSWRGQIVTWR